MVLEPAHTGAHFATNVTNQINIEEIYLLYYSMRHLKVVVNRNGSTISNSGMFEILKQDYK
jgi:hypothetical protein